MRLHRLHLLNFRQHADTEIDVGAGITAIIGPNGAGKTTLLEAIAWGFYGNAAARGSRDSIRWNRAPARSSVRVEVDFGVGAHEFRVVRGLYNAELYQDRFDRPIVNTHQEVSARIEHVLGMTRQEFFNTYFTGQKELAVMAAMGPTDRGKFLSRVLGYEKLRLAQDRLRERRTALRGELTGLEQGLADPAELEAERAKAVEQFERSTQALTSARKDQDRALALLEEEGPTWTRAVEQREASANLDSDRRVAERDVVEARREFQRLDRELAEALDARSGLAGLAEQLARVSPLREELDRLEEEARSAGQRRALIGELKAIEEQTARETDRLSRLGDVSAALSSAQAAIVTARSELETAEAGYETARTAWVRDKQDAQTKRLSLRDQYLDLQKQRASVLKAGEEGECPICKRPLGGVFEETERTLERQLEEIEVRGKFFKRRLEQLEQPVPEVQEAEGYLEHDARAVEGAVQEVARCEDRVKEASEHQGELTRLSGRGAEIEEAVATLPDRYDSERHDTVRAELRALDPVVKEAAGLEVKARAAEALVAEAETAERLLSERERRLTDLEAAIGDLGFDETAYAQARTGYESAQQAARDAELAIASLEADLKATSAAVQVADQRIAEREGRAARVAELATDVRLHDELDRALQDLRSELNAQMRPDLSERASDFLAALTDGRYNELEIDEEYDVSIVEDGLAKPVISGGEEDVANLALRLAISQMVAERAGQPLSLLVLDEIFGSLDEYRRRSVIELLRALADRFPQVILITHIDSVREGVDRVLRVEVDQRRGVATITEDSPTNVAA